jgi:hypothetical protein
MAKPRIERFDGAGSYQKAQNAARFGHADWIQWSDADGSHAARLTADSLKAMMAINPEHWALISANDGVAMKGFDYLAKNVLAQFEAGWR